MSTKEGPPARTARAMRAERRHQLRKTAQPSNDSRDPQIDPSPNQDTQGTTGQISEPLAENVVTAPGPSFPSTLSSVPSNISGREDANTEATNYAESPPGQNTGRGTSIRFGTIGEDEEDGASVRTYEHEQGRNPQKKDLRAGRSKGKNACTNHPRLKGIPQPGTKRLSPSIATIVAAKEMDSDKRNMKGEYVTTENEINSIHFRVLDSHRRLEEMSGAIADIQTLASRLIANDPGPSPLKKAEPSPRALASQALFADRGTSEESAEYTQRKRAQARFRIVSRPQIQAGVDDMTPPARGNSEEAVDRMTPDATSTPGPTSKHEDLRTSSDEPTQEGNPPQLHIENAKA
ncbi:hypothetical protein BC826DRAFT_974421 [Russula brevipes]|nr:hypothetical protein BC826DRAFT_974421 [Russula brevipes]